ncbi:MAG: chorismate synthase [bacterium]
MSSSIGKLFIVTTFGESHGAAIGAVVDGCPSGVPLCEADIQRQLDRRRPGQSLLTTSRNEADRVEILSGVDGRRTLGSPIGLLIRNADQRPADYKRLTGVPRPSHADLTYMLKYGVIASSGGGRASARETAARVAAGAVAEKFLAVRIKVRIVAWVSSVGEIDARDMTSNPPSREDVDAGDARCPDRAADRKMADEILRVKKAGDSVGGVVTCVCSGVPAGWGEPVFDKMGAMLGSAMLSIPAVKGFEMGSGFGGARMLGSRNNDMFVKKGGRIGTVTNRSGGVQGGITNGEPLVMRVAFKPTATIARAQKTVDFKGRPVKLEAAGRHDPCVVLRAVPVVEAMAAIVLADAALQAGGL